MLGVYFVEDLHRLDHAQRLAGDDGLSRGDEGRVAGRSLKVHDAEQRRRQFVRGARRGGRFERGRTFWSNGRRCISRCSDVNSRAPPHQAQRPAVLAELHLGEVRRRHGVDEGLDLLLVHAAKVSADGRQLQDGLGVPR